jgi:hypothetical protein
MKRLAIVSAVLCLLALGQVVQAADLQTGWYAKIQSIDVFIPGDPIWLGPQLVASGYFYQTPPGQYGLFQVDGGTPNRDNQRYVYVNEDAYGIGLNDSLALPLSFGLTQGTQIAFLSIAWATNYDPAQMQLQLWQNHSNGSSEMLWSQKQGGVKGNSENAAFNTILDGTYYFKVSVVPEPSSATCLVAAFGCLLGALRLRRA